jgi:hypothetical protein
MNNISESEMLNDLAKADAAGDSELANVIASKIKEQRIYDKILGQNKEEDKQVKPIESDSSGIEQQRMILSTITGKMVPEGTSETINPYAREQTMRGLAQVARMGPVIAAAPLTGGMSVLGAMGTMGLVSGLSELGAQGIEYGSGQRNDINARNIAASTVAGSAPVFGPSSGFIKALAGNVAGTVTASELANYISNPDEYSAPKGAKEYLSRLVIPATLASTATTAANVGSNLSKINEAKKAIESARMGGNVMLGELIPQWTKGEARQLARGNPKALASYNGALSKISANVIDELSKYADGETAKAVVDKIVINNMIKPEQIEGLLNEVNIASKFKSEADKVALKTMLVEYGKKAVTGKILAGGIPELNRIAQTGKSGGIIQDVHLAADIEAEGKIRDWYNAAGVKMDDPVVSRSTTLTNIAKSQILARDDKINLSTSISKLFGEKETLTLSEYRKARDIIADELINGGAGKSSAKRVATEGFSAIKDASEEFLQKVLPPEDFLTFTKANSLAKNRFDAISSDAIDLVESGKTEDLYDNIMREGPSNRHEVRKYNTSVSTYDGLIKYSDMIENTVGLDAANEYRRNMHSMIRDGAFKKALKTADGYVGFERVYNTQKLITEFASLDRAGIDIGKLGVGTIEDVRNMAKAFSIANADTISSKDVSEFIRITSMGGDYGKYKAAFNDLRRTFLEDKGFPTAERINKVLERHKDAKLPLSALRDAVDAVQADPLTQLLKSPSEAGGVGSYGLNKTDLTRNVKWTESLLEMDTADVRKFAEALKKSGRTDELETLAKTAATNTLFLFEDFSKSSNPAIKAKDIANIFFGNERGGIKLRNNLKVLMGDSAYGKMMNDFVNPSADFVKYTQQLVSSAGGSNNEVLKGLASIKGLVEGKTTGGTLVTNALVNSMNLTRVVGYNNMYNLILGESSDALAKAGYNLSKFASASPVNAVIVNLGIREKEKLDQERAQKSPQ